MPNRTSTTGLLPRIRQSLADWRSRDTEQITVYFDESGTHKGSQFLLVGAVVSTTPRELERTTHTLQEKLVANDYLWSSTPEKRDVFKAHGFHHNEDSENIRGQFIDHLQTANIRAHVCYSQRSLQVPDDALLLNMYFVLIQNLVRRYWGSRLRLVFEENEALNMYFARISAEVVARLKLRTDDAPQTFIGSKPMPGLAAVDYILAVCKTVLGDEQSRISAAPISNNFRRERYEALRPHIASLINFDHAIYRSGWTGTLL